MYRLFILDLFIMGIIVGTSIFYIYQIDINAKSLKEYQSETSLMFEKIYELRRSIDDLTRFARTYVITQEQLYKDNYIKILQIRNGNIAKPKNYFSVYWDLLEPLRKIRHPHVSTNQSSLENEMKELPYSEEELQMLEESKIYTEELLNLEKKAFYAVENNNKSLAINLLFSMQYHHIKEKAMLPIDKFIMTLTKRTNEKIELFNKTNKELYKVLYYLIFIGFAVVIVTIYIIFRRIIIPIEKLTQAIILFKHNKNVEVFPHYKDEIGFLIKNFFQMKQKIDQDLKLLKYNASHDPLTNIYNRGAFFEIADKIFKLSKRDNRELSVLILDVDYFKKINDAYGHIIGDEVLKFISSNISSQLRTSDILGRYGGEEFIVLLPDTSIDNASKLAIKINEYIFSNHFTDKTHDIKLSISIGVATKKNEGNLTDIINKADNALYKAKNSGRNCVHKYENSETLAF